MDLSATETPNACPALAPTSQRHGSRKRAPMGMIATQFNAGDDGPLRHTPLRAAPSTAVRTAVDRRDLQSGAHRGGTLTRETSIALLDPPLLVITARATSEEPWTDTNRAPDRICVDIMPQRTGVRSPLCASVCAPPTGTPRRQVHTGGTDAAGWVARWWNTRCAATIRSADRAEIVDVAHPVIVTSCEWRQRDLPPATR